MDLGDGSTAYPLKAVLDPQLAQGHVQRPCLPPGSKKLTELELFSLGTGTSVAITGIWQPAPPQKEQQYELKAKSVKIIGTADAEVVLPTLK